MLSTAIDFSPVTELTGVQASSQQLAMLYHRYRTALPYCMGKDVLEVASGGGQGLTFLADRAHRAVGGDCVRLGLLDTAKQVEGRANIAQFDAQALPFREASFDTILILEALYYLRDANQFVEECRRVLRPSGTLIISTVNREWADFNPSLFSTKYFAADELSEFLVQHGFNASISGAFPVEEPTLTHQVISAIRRAAIRLRLIPKSFKYKAYLKRLFYGPLVPVPPRLVDGMADYVTPVGLGSGSVTNFKVLYAVGTAAVVSM